MPYVTPRYDYAVWDGTNLEELQGMGASLRVDEERNVLQYFYPTSTWVDMPLGTVVVRGPGQRLTWNAQLPAGFLNSNNGCVYLYPSLADMEEDFAPVA
jgi:hypothetical protein